jgi:uncharacterized membrane protein YeiB
MTPNVVAFVLYAIAGTILSIITKRDKVGWLMLATGLVVFASIIMTLGKCMEGGMG